MSEGTQNFLSERTQGQTRAEAGGVQLLCVAIKLPGGDPITGPKDKPPLTHHTSITYELLTDDQLRLLDTLKGRDAEEAYGYITTSGKYVWGAEAVDIARDSGLIDKSQNLVDITLSETADEKKTLH